MAISRISLNVGEGVTVKGALAMYAEQHEADTLTSTGEEARWHQREAKDARKVLALMSQMNHAGSSGHWELIWHGEE